MKTLVYLLLACILLSSCNAERRALRKSRKDPVTTNYDLPRPAVGDTAHVQLVTPGPPKAADKPTIAADGSTVVLPKKIKNGSVSVNIGSGSSTSSTAGKKAAAATGTGATTTSIGNVKAPTAVGDSAVAQDFTKQGQRGGNAASGDNATATNTQSGGWNLWKIIILVLATLYVGWYALSGTLWAKMQVWFPAREKRIAVAIAFALVGAGLIYWLS